MDIAPDDIPMAILCQCARGGTTPRTSTGIQPLPPRGTWPSAGKESVNTIDIGVDSISILFHASALTNVSHWFFQLAFLD